ncbi:Hypothetical predicted protein [Podarcis lilfordi]|uniref:Uncharacterized protein n=1 Tax=Podarcis lilfordi TaxID=74358 RepID=A0AA35K6Q7_9SAUR|nr:Hypothetical predicted protein [Podarcis lilfordi]
MAAFICQSSNLWTWVEARSKRSDQSRHGYVQKSGEETAGSPMQDYMDASVVKENTTVFATRSFYCFFSV